MHCGTEEGTTYTFGKQASSTIFMFTQIPPISEIIVSLDKLYVIASNETEFVRASRMEIIWSRNVSQP
jgi:hypothetical protein